MRDTEMGVRSLFFVFFFVVRDEHTSPSFPNQCTASGYAPLLADLKAPVRAADVRPVLLVNCGNGVVKGDANLFLCPSKDFM